MKTLPDYLEKGLKVLFVGTNPGVKSAEAGHYYFNESRNSFWKILHGAGLTDRKLSPEEDREILSYGYGLTDLVKRPTRRIRDIKENEFKTGAERLRRIIREYKPKIVCFNGKTAFRKFACVRGKVDFGLQEIKSGESSLFVAPSTSNAFPMKREGKVEVYRKLLGEIK